MAEEGIRSSKEAAWDMDDFEVKISEIKQPLRLAMVEVLCLMEVHQVLVVGKDLDGERGSMEVVPPGFQGMDDCEELSVIDIVIMLCRNKQLREVGAGMPVTVGVGLEEDSARGILRGVDGNGKGFGEVREVEDGA